MAQTASEGRQQPKGAVGPTLRFPGRSKHMAHALELRVVAEGVEDARAWAILEALSCDVMQGYYVCRALPAAELERRLRSAATMPRHALW